MMSHLSRQHGDVDIESPTVHSLLTSFPQDEDNMIDLDLGNGSPGPTGEARDQVNEDCCPHLTAQQSLKRSAALFLLTLKERYQLTQSALDFTVSQVKEMMFYDHEDNWQPLIRHLAAILVQIL